MGYIAIPGSNTDLYSGTILSAIAGTAAGIDGVVLGNLSLKSVHQTAKILYISATGMPFTIKVSNLDADQTDSNGFDLVYTQTPCTVSI